MSRRSRKRELEVRVIGPEAWTLLRPAPDACPLCARKHESDAPHDPRSLYWGTARKIAGLPAPTWTEALAHVPAEARARWIEILATHGITVPT